MSNQNQQQQKKALTASQRLDGLEAAQHLLDRTVSENAATVEGVVKAITLLSTKLEATRRILGVSDESLAAMIQTLDLEDLKDRIDDLLKKGVIVPSEEVQAATSFLVIRELDPEGKEVIHQRKQFPMFNQDAEVKKALAGKKAGDIVKIYEGKNLVEIVEVYEVVLPKKPSAQKPEGEGEKLEAASDEGSAESEPSKEAAPEATA